MILTPSTLVTDLHGTCGEVTARRRYGTILIGRRAINDTARLRPPVPPPAPVELHVSPGALGLGSTIPSFEASAPPGPVSLELPAGNLELKSTDPSFHY